MAESNPELQAKLRELDHELEEGDITTKGCVGQFPRKRNARCRRRVKWRVPAER